MSSAVTRTRLCLVFNVVTLLAIGVFCGVFGQGGYMRFGPSDDFSVVGIRINSWPRWIALSLSICFISVADALINEWGMPFVSFRIYNPDCKEIKDVGPIELQILANGMYACAALKGVLYTIVAVTQIDIALIRVLSGETATIFTIRGLIKEKKFVTANNSDDAPLLVISTYS